MKNFEEAIQDKLEQIPLTKDEAVRLASERQQQITQLTKAGYEQAKLSEELQKQFEKVQQTLQEKNKRIADLETKQAEEFQKQLEKMQRSLQEKNKRIDDLETKIAERTYREQLLDNEMIKAEAQLDLIKDVLMREPGI